VSLSIGGMIAGVVIGATLLLLVVNLGSLLLKRYGRHVFKSKVYSYVSVVLLNVAQWNSSKWKLSNITWSFVVLSEQRDYFGQVSLILVTAMPSRK
jgi:hypothetical protein